MNFCNPLFFPRSHFILANQKIARWQKFTADVRKTLSVQLVLGAEKNGTKNRDDSRIRSAINRDIFRRKNGPARLFRSITQLSNSGAEIKIFGNML